LTITTEKIRNIQAGLGAQEPNFDRSEPGITPAAGASGVPIPSTNGVPSGPTAGSPVTVSTGASGIYTALVVRIPGTLTSLTMRWWAYYPALLLWALLDGSERAIDVSWTQLIPSGPIARLYCEVTARTGTGDATPHIGPSDLGGA
jgi:hypothetical protein